MDVLSARDFHVNIYFRYLAFDHSFRCWLKELLLRGRFSLLELLLRDRFSVVGGLSRLLLVGWRIIEAPACLVGGLSRLLLVWLEDYLRYCLFGLFCR